MIFLNVALLVGAVVGLLFGIFMTVWIWRTRPAASYGPRRTDPVVAARLAALYAEDAPRIPTGGAALGRGGRAATRPPNEAPAHLRVSVDGRRRDLVRSVAM